MGNELIIGISKATGPGLIRAEMIQLYDIFKINLLINY